MILLFSISNQLSSFSLIHWNRKYLLCANQRQTRRYSQVWIKGKIPSWYPDSIFLFPGNIKLNALDMLCKWNKPIIKAWLAILLLPCFFTFFARGVVRLLDIANNFCMSSQRSRLHCKHSNASVAITTLLLWRCYLSDDSLIWGVTGANVILYGCQACGNKRGRGGGQKSLNLRRRALWMAPKS